MDKNSTTDGAPLLTPEAWFDPIEAEVRERVRGFLEEMIEQEVTAALGRRRCQRGEGGGYRNGMRSRRLLGSFGPIEIAVPRIHRVLVGKGIESHVVDPASVATSRRQRRAKTDKLDGDALVRTLLAYKRGEPRVCAMVQVPTPEEEDRRRLSRERRTLLKERVQHSNRIKGLLFGQGISGYEPLRPDCRQRLGELQTADGRPLPCYLKAQIDRELDRLGLVLEQLRAVEEELRHAIAATPRALMAFKGIGTEFATVLWTECLYRSFNNRRQVAAYAGLAPTPWQSGSIGNRSVESRQSPPTDHSDPARLALGPPPA